MTSVCLYFQLHQPYRLRRYSVFDSHPFYFDNDTNRAIFEKVAERCYRPATRLILDLVRRHEGRFRLGLSMTGVFMEQMQAWAPDVLEPLAELAASGRCELLAETSHHSLAFLYSREEFSEQVETHRQWLRRLFNVEPATFRNTELLYQNDLAAHLGALGRFRTILCEGVDRLLGQRTPNHIYVPPGRHADLRQARLRLLLKNHRMSDDIAFRFSDRSWPGWPLTADTFARWIHQLNGQGSVCNLFMDFETLGEHQWSETGIFEFMEHLPAKVLELAPGQNDFLTPGEAAARYAPVGEYNVPAPTSWADTERDLSAWTGNAMQQNAAAELYRLEPAVKSAYTAGDEYLLEDWRKLTCSDHLYYMSTKYWADGEVHKYFSPYESPYEAYINYMNVIDHVRRRTEG
jgi:alpha-amylase